MKEEFDLSLRLSNADATDKGRAMGEQRAPSEGLLTCIASDESDRRICCQ